MLILATMNSQLVNLTVEITLQPGEKLSLPQPLIDSVGAGDWLITIQPATASLIRNHSAFLNGYAPEDEGLYDDYPSG